MITCSVVQKAFGFNDCCSSCHEDADEGYGELAGDGVNYSVCCGVLQFLNKQGISAYGKVTYARLLAAVDDMDREFWGNP